MDKALRHAQPPHKQGTFQAHGSPLGADEVRAAKQSLGWPLEPAFFIPDEARALFCTALERGRVLEQEWRGRLSAHRRQSAPALHASPGTRAGGRRRHGRLQASGRRHGLDGYGAASCVQRPDPRCRRSRAGAGAAQAARRDRRRHAVAVDVAARTRALADAARRRGDDRGRPRQGPASRVSTTGIHSITPLGTRMIGLLSGLLAGRRPGATPPPPDGEGTRRR